MSLPWGSNAYGIGEWGTGLENITVFPTGIGASASLGNETIVAEVNEGWGRLTWGENGWGIQGDVLVSGVSGSVSLGDESISIDVNPIPTGIEMTASQGDESIEISFEIELTGLPFTSNLGTADAGPDAMLQGIGFSANVGTLEAYNLEGWGRYFWGQFEWGATGEWEFVTPTGISMSANVGTISATGNAEITLDSSIQFTAEGNAQLSTAQQKFGTASLLLDGTDDYVESDSSIDLSSSDFTIDLWIRPDNVTGYKGIWQSGTSTTEQSYLLGNQVYWSVNPSTIITTSVTVNANEWTMLSYERQGNTHRIYKNGTLEDTATTGNKQDNGPFTIGKNGFGDFDGYIDEVRVSDIARYTGSSFTEPTSEFSVDSDTIALLHFDGADGSTDMINAVNEQALVLETNIGDESAFTDHTVEVTGQQLTMSMGEETPAADANVQLTGIQLTGSVGTVDAVAVYEVTGVQMSTSVGSVTVTGTANVNITGIELQSSAGNANVTAWAEIDTGVSNVWTEVDRAA